MRAEIAQARYTYLRIRAVAETLACSEVHVRELVKGGAFTFPGLRAPINVGKPGGGRLEYRIPPEALERFLAERAVKAGEGDPK